MRYFQSDLFTYYFSLSHEFDKLKLVGHLRVAKRGC
jgi:hypothetical protein